MIDKLRTPRFRLAFPALWTPRAYKGKGTPTYQITMLFDKKAIKEDPEQAAAFKAITDMVNATAIEKWGHIPKTLVSPIKKGETKSEYNGFDESVVFMKAETQFNSFLIINAARQNIEDQGEMYAGCYCYATLTPYTTEYNDDKYVKFNFHGVQKAADGDPIGSNANTIDDFAALETVASVDDDLFGE